MSSNETVCALEPGVLALAMLLAVASSRLCCAWSPLIATYMLWSICEASWVGMKGGVPGAT